MEEVKKYIENCRKKGQSDLVIKEKLLANGWIEEQINVFFEDEVPKPSFQEKTPESNISFKNYDYKKLDHKAKTLFFLKYLSYMITVFILVIPIFIPPIMRFFEEDMNFIHLLPIVFVLILSTIISMVFGELHYKFYKYSISKEGFKKEYGIISKKFITIPYSKIQNIDIKQTLLERILGIYSINIQTAGTSGKIGAEGILPGLNYNDANVLRTKLLEKASIH